MKFYLTFLTNAPNLSHAGIHVTFDVSNPPGRRIVMVHVRCGNCTVPRYAPLNDSDVLVVITPEFLADGGLGFSMLKTNILRREKIPGENGEECEDIKSFLNAPLLETVTVLLLEAGFFEVT